MTAPDLGPCTCDLFTPAPHEHSDFPPHACTEPGCGCEVWTDPPPYGAESPAAAPEPPSAGVRKGVTLPADLGFARERVETVAAWLDEVTQTVRANGVSDPSDPYAVCALADLLEEHTPEGIDPLDALALAIRRNAARTTAREAWEAMRRKVRR